MRAAVLLLLTLATACRRERAEGVTDDAGAAAGVSSGGAAAATAGGDDNGGAGGRSADGGVATAGDGARDGEAGTAGAAGAAGQGGEGGNPPWTLCGFLPEGPCGDSVIHCGEDCDGEVFFRPSCADYGFESGALACNDDCTVDLSDCAGTEICDDARDNDGDGAVDCVDEDCADRCGDPCATPQLLDDPGTVSATTASQPNAMDPSCVISGSGPEAVFTVTPAHSGVLEVRLATFGCLVVSARTACSAPTSELGCGVGADAGSSEGATIAVPVTAGETLFVIVEGCDPTFAGEFTLEVASSGG